MSIFNWCIVDGCVSRYFKGKLLETKFASEFRVFGHIIILVLVSLSRILLSGGSRPLVGDILYVAGTIFFALSNVGEVG